MGGAQNDRRRHTRGRRLSPAARAETPSVPGGEAGETGFRYRRGQIIAAGASEFEERLGDLRADHVGAPVGRAGLDALAIDSVRIWLDEVSIVRDGGRDPEYTEAAGQAVMARDALTVRIALGRGTASVEIMTCDLSYDYVKINAEYRS